MKSPAPAENEVPGSLKLQGDSSENAGDDQSKNGLFLATNGAMAAEAASGCEVSGSSLPVGQPSYLTPMSQRPKPDYELPTDSNGQPYGPMCIHRNTNPANAEKWDDALAHWKQHEATPGEVATYEHAQTYRLDTWTKINDVRVKKDPAMPTFSNIAYEEIPYTLEGIDALRPKLNEVELDYIGTLTAVAETDPRHPTKTDCYCPSDKRFYRKIGKVYKCFTQSQYETQLFAEGFSGGSTKTRTIARKCEIDKISQRVILRQVTVVKGLSGLDQGYHDMGLGAGEYLALTGPVFPEESEGAAPNMMAYLMELTNAESDDGEQLSRLLDWMADAYTRRKSVNRGQHRALLIAGPASSGKGLLKDIIATLLGGRHRATNASKYLLGKTDFNGEWIKADLLYLDDAVGDGKIATKIQTADAIKGVVAGGQSNISTARTRRASTCPCGGV